MRIGISVLTHQGQNIWENGLGQNIVFLAQAFRQIPFVKSVDLINCGDQATVPQQIDLDAQGLRLLSLADAATQLDVAIEMGGGLEVKWLDHFRAQGKKAVWYCAGHPYNGLVEPSIFGSHGYFSRTERCDAIWMIPEYFAHFAPMTRTLHRCAVLQVPYLWSPEFLDQRVNELRQSGQVWGYAERANNAATPAPGFRVAIMEPNISVAKTCTIPMLACDEAYRADAGSVQAMHVLNTLHMKDHPTLLHLANSLNLVQQHKAVFHGRHDFAGFMALNADAVVSHQWLNDQNYLYLDALHGGYPLVHNSPWIKDLGYYYPDFDAPEAGRQLLRAARDHDANLPAYRQAAQRLITSLAPTQETNVRAYARLLLALSHNLETA